MQSYFDLGISFGLVDDVLTQLPTPADPNQYPYHLNEPERARRHLGIRNPLGEGVLCRLEKTNKELIKKWTDTAIAFVDDPEMDPRYQTADPHPREALKNQLRSLIKAHPIETCHLHIYAVGTVFLRTDFSNGLQNHLDKLLGFLNCYEFAAYSPEVSQLFLDVAYRTAVETFKGQARGLQELSRRPPPALQRDSRGGRQSTLFTSFTCVALCVHESDKVEAILSMLLKIEGQPFERLEFAYHGALHFGWAVCLVEPRPPSERTEDVLVEVDRMLYCIQLAHVFLGTCEAFETLFVNEAIHQADGYLKGIAAGRSPRELNRLRTLASAVVSLTRYESTTASDEDQGYFNCFERHAKIRERQRLIQEQCEVLHNIQDAEIQAQEARQEGLLNRIVLILTAFTLVSVLADSYTFVRHQERWLEYWPHRVQILVSLFTVIVLVIGIIFRSLRRRGRKR